MKKYVFILMAIMLLALAPAVYSADFENSTIPGLNMTTDIDLAMNAAQSENKSVVIFFDQASCVYCDMLKSNVLSNSDVQKQLNENYVFLLVDINENPKFADKYRVYGTPIIKFIEPSGKVIHEIQGYVEADEFLKELKEI